MLETVQIGGIARRELNLTQMQGGVGAINVFGTVQVGQTPSHAATPLSRQEYRWRQVLLGKVKQFWIEGVLNKSLHTQVVFELGLEKRSNLIPKPLSGVEEFVSDERHVLPEGTTASKVFEDIGAGRTLLILGEPGAGKTVTLLKLADSLITRSEKDLSQPLPVVMNLSSWAKQRKPIENWLVQQLNEVYEASKLLGKTWIDQEQLILLLDGLDEVDSQYRNDCVKALNQFIHTHGLTEIVVCSRIGDYEALAERLKLRSAIYVRSLTTQQIDDFLDSAGKSLVVLKRAIKHNVELQQLASSPLMLSIMSLAYQDCPVEALPQAGTTERQRKQLLDTYVDRMFTRRGTTRPYLNEQTLHWLNFLAKQMVQTSQTIFLIERIQPSWLQTRVQRILHCLVSGLICGLICGLIVGLIGALIGVLESGLGDELIGALIFGLIVRLIGALIGVLGFLLFVGDIEPVESLSWSLKSSKKFCCPGLIFGLIFGLIGALISVLESGLIYGLIGALIAGLRGPEMQKRFKPNQGIWKSTQHAWVLTLIYGLIFGLIFGLDDALIFGLIYGLIFALIAGLISGGSASIRHFALRLMLYRMGHSPWNYARFLDHAADRLFLQKVGGGYIFVHRMLLEHFAEMELDRKQG